MVVNSVVKSENSYLLFPVIKKVDISIDEIIQVKLYEGNTIVGVVDEICNDGEHFWLRVSPEKSSFRERFSFKIDRIFKLN